MRAIVAVLIAGCGRFGFDGVPDAPAASADAPADAISFADSLACEQDVIVTTVPRVDSVRWVDLGSRVVLVALHHVANTDHRIHAYELRAGAALVSDTTVWSTADMFGPVVTSDARGLVVADATATTTHVLTLDAQLANAVDHPITTFGWATQGYAESGGARLIVGRDGSSTIQVLAVDATLTPTAAMVTAGAGDLPYLAPAASGFVLAYTDAQGCELERLANDGTVTAGPLTIAIACSNPMVAELSTGAIAYALTSGSMPPTAFAGVANASLTSTTSPMVIGAADSFPETLLPAGDHALLAVRTTGDSRIVQLASDGTPSTLGADFALAGTDIDAATIAMIGGSLIHAHTESGNLVVRKLCR